MCTVTYLPTSNHTFILTSSRDERIGRKPAHFPVLKQTFSHVPVLFPQDGNKGGTWVAAGCTLTVCLLNGAFENHNPQPSYRISRGLVVLAVFDYDTVDNFVHTYDLQDIEPFTMIILQQAEGITLTELRWDGSRKHITIKDAKQPHIWSSVTLYTQEMRKEREAWFTQWLKQHSYSLEAIRGFHQQAGKTSGTFYSIRMNRPGLVSTMSITSVVSDTMSTTMHYQDLVAETYAQETICQKAYFPVL